MPLEKVFINRNILDSNGPFPSFNLNNPVHQKKRITVRKNVHNAIDIDFLCSFLEGRVPENPRADVALPYTLSMVIDDLKSYYYEAITAQPGQESVSSQVLTNWFWSETIAGQVLFSIREVSKKSEDVFMQIVGSALIVPTSVRHNQSRIGDTV